MSRLVTVRRLGAKAAAAPGELEDDPLSRIAKYIPAVHRRNSAPVNGRRCEGRPAAVRTATSLEVSAWCFGRVVSARNPLRATRSSCYVDNRRRLRLHVQYPSGGVIAHAPV